MIFHQCCSRDDSSIGICKKETHHPRAIVRIYQTFEYKQMT